MDVSVCLPSAGDLILLSTQTSPHVVWLNVESRARSALCPQCGRPSSRRHSHYVRVLKDVPLLDRRVRWHLTVRKFLCDVLECPQRIFCERLPRVTAPWRRITRRLEHQQRLTALEAGAQSAARILKKLGSGASANTLLARLRSPVIPKHDRPIRILGIDDWAWRKGQRYGTILVDLERHQVVDLLADRDAATLIDWLKQHPDIELITRDRSTTYQEAATLGAPQAAQVADRWHLVNNVRETLERFLLRRYETFRTIARTLPSSPAPASPRPNPAASPLSHSDPIPSNVGPPTARQMERFAAVQNKLREGMPVKQVAREVGVAPGTVRKYLHLDSHPGNARPRHRPGELAPFHVWLQQQWAAGARQATALYTQLRAMGYGGGYTAVREYCRLLRLSDPASVRPWVCPSPRTLSWAMLNPTLIRTPQLLTLLERHATEHPDDAKVTGLLIEGWHLFRGMKSRPLSAWLTALTESGVRELQTFAVGIDRDYDAVQRALETPYSNGQVDGQVNRLKTVKRSMYGRARLDLLRARVVYRSGLA
ncbi:ISL3 family transposase [Deinococcus sp. JMULE3]|uniref:ISL3 family transposase n=1 Tax=Deinococcus sp. JMULE3 TaxID=2518341 RepID=UPI0015757BC6|nr:ISL3 family transposase [Deinococcus sp. JMULE3]NTY02524.1 ISL3 family transposase [Deinococcus sp. JMULE3]